MKFNKFIGKRIIKAVTEEKLHNDILERNKNGWHVASDMKYIANDNQPFQILMKYIAV